MRQKLNKPKKITVDKISKFVKIMSNHIGIFKHDIRNAMMAFNGLYNEIELNPECFDDIVKRCDKNDTITLPKSFLLDLVKYGEKMTNIMNNYMMINRIDDSTFDYMWCNPRDVLLQVQKCNINNIKLSNASQKTINLFYPSNCLFGIFNELVTNAIKHNGNNTKILVSWKLYNNYFVCYVHDNGSYLLNNISRKYVPLSSIVSKEESGLKLVDRLVCVSGGKILLSKSKYLGGNLIYFDLPNLII